MKKNTPLFLLALLSAFLAGEIFLRIYAQHHSLYAIEMNRYSLFAKTGSPDPRIGHVHRPNAAMTLMGVKVRINSDGLRDREHAIPKGDKYRIVFLGDSLTFGWGVNEEDTFKSLLEKKINSLYPAEILNFGTGNYNTEQEVSFFVQKGLKYNPDGVVLFFFINDAELTPRKSGAWFLGYSYIATSYRALLEGLAVKLWPSRGYQRYYRDLYRPGAEGWERTQKALLRLKEICEERAIRLQVVLLPDLHDLRNYPFLKETARIGSFLEENHISYLDVRPALPLEQNPRTLWVADDDAHPNALAHRLIAGAAFDFIASGKD